MCDWLFSNLQKIIESANIRSTWLYTIKGCNYLCIIAKNIADNAELEVLN